MAQRQCINFWRLFLWIGEDQCLSLLADRLWVSLIGIDPSWRRHLRRVHLSYFRCQLSIWRRTVQDGVLLRYLYFLVKYSIDDLSVGRRRLLSSLLLHLRSSADAHATVGTRYTALNHVVAVDDWRLRREVRWGGDSQFLFARFCHTLVHRVHNVIVSELWLFGRHRCLPLHIVDRCLFIEALLVWYPLQVGRLASGARNHDTWCRISSLARRVSSWLSLELHRGRRGLRRPNQHISWLSGTPRERLIRMHIWRLGNLVVFLRANYLTALEKATLAQRHYLACLTVRGCLLGWRWIQDLRLSNDLDVTVEANILISVDQRARKWLLMRCH